jgi:hypothetical protein
MWKPTHINAHTPRLTHAWLAIIYSGKCRGAKCETYFMPNIRGLFGKQLLFILGNQCRNEGELTHVR